jgi:HK97 gp10 family phage protein
MRIQATVQFRRRGDGGQFVASNITPAVRAAIQECGELVRDTAKMYCPVDTGALQESISSTLDDTGKTIIARVEPGMHYAMYVEFGTGMRGVSSPGAGPLDYDPNWPGMVAQPYMRPAYDECAPKIKDILGSHVTGAMQVLR